MLSNRPQAAEDEDVVLHRDQRTAFNLDAGGSAWVLSVGIILGEGEGDAKEDR